MSIGLTDILVALGSFPLLEDLSLLGGMRAVTNVTARNAIPAAHRKAGMFVFTQSEEQLWRLDSGLTNSDWIEFTGGSTIINGDLDTQEGSLVVIGFYGKPLTIGDPDVGEVYAWDGGSFTLTPLGIQYGGDLADNGGSPVVVGIQTVPVNATVPNTGEALVYNGTDYAPAPIATLNGDLTDGGGGVAKVIALQANPIADVGTPNEGDLLTWTSGQWTPLSATGTTGAYYKTIMSATSADTTTDDVAATLVTAVFTDFTVNNSLIIDASANVYMDAPGYVFFRVIMGETPIRSGKIYVPGGTDQGAAISFHEHLPNLSSGGSVGISLDWAVENNGDTATCIFATMRLTEVLDYVPGP